MSGWVLGVLASLVAALLLGIAGLAIRIWRQLSLRRLAHRERRGVRRQLAAHLGVQSPGSKTRLSRYRIESLADSFRVQLASRYELSRPGSGILDASALLKHVAQHGERVYLVNAESGYGKTALGMALSLLRPYEGLTPLYIDLAEADSDEPLVAVEQMLTRLRGERGRKHSGQPLFVIDALNESVDPVYFCERLATRDSELRQLGAKLLFLFSFRHRSYSSRLRAALLAHELGPLEQMELLFDLDNDRDLAFFPELVQSQRIRRLDSGQMASVLRAYGARFPPNSLSREDLRAYLEKSYAREGSAGGASGDRTALDPEEAPAPATLRFAALIGAKAKPSTALSRLAVVAFSLLSQEVTVTTYVEAAGACQTTETELRKWVPESGLEGLICCGNRHLRFENESTVRALGALHIAGKLIDDKSPDVLRGHTAYDVCAPYLQPALSWELAGRNGGVQTVEKVVASIRDALSGRDGPYSFYATALCSEKAGVLADHREVLDALLFGQMIIAIDDDRAKSCFDSLEAAGRSEPQPTLEPVLDQLFEVMGAYGRQAVGLLLATMDSAQPLVRSQAAYLLLDWLSNTPVPTRERDKEPLAMIPAQMSGEDGNLHVRFHQVEVLEAIINRFSHRSEAPYDVGTRLAEIAEADPDPAGLREVEDVYAECQRLVAMRAKLLTGSSNLDDVHQRMSESVRHCMQLIDGDDHFQSLGTGAGIEARLECWEVTLGFAVHMCGRLRRNAEFTSFIEAALEHPFWIVRWWAFVGLIGIIKAASKVDDRVLTARCARRAAEQLCNSIEPMGLKHRQCAITRRLLIDNSGASHVMRMALSGAANEHLTPARRQAFAEAYYEVMGASPDAYLSEFFRRLEEIVPSAE